MHIFSSKARIKLPSKGKIQQQRVFESPECADGRNVAKVCNGHVI